MIETHLVFGCSHFPFHNKDLYIGILKLIKDVKFTHIDALGDILDMNSLSFHDYGLEPIVLENGKEVDLGWEYRESNKALDQLDDAIGRRKVKKRYVFGNHEDRYNRKLKNVQIKKYGSAFQSPLDGCRLLERGWEVKTNWKEDYFMIGDHLQGFHGELLGVNPAKRQLDKLKKSCIFFHSHRFGSHYDGDLASYNMGGLFDKTAPAFYYAGRLAKRNWVNGFAIVTVDDHGDYYVNPISAYKDRFYYNGKKYGK